MNDLIGIGFIAMLLLGAVFGLMYLSKPYDVTTEEFEKRAHEAPSLISAGMSGLQKILDPAAGKSNGSPGGLEARLLQREQRIRRWPGSG